MSRDHLTEKELLETEPPVMKPEVELAMTFVAFAKHCRRAGLTHPCFIEGSLFASLGNQIRALTPENEPFFQGPIGPIPIDSMPALLDEVDRIVSENLGRSDSTARIAHSLGRLRLRVLEDLRRSPGPTQAD